MHISYWSSDVCSSDLDRANREETPVLVLALYVLHAELAEVREMAEGRPISDWAPWVDAISGIENYPSAVIVAVPAQATCGGLEMSVAADIRVAAPTALPGLLETRMGILPGPGGTQRLPEFVGPGDAELLVPGGNVFPGTEAPRRGWGSLSPANPV